MEEKVCVVGSLGWGHNAEIGDLWDQSRRSHDIIEDTSSSSMWETCEIARCRPPIHLVVNHQTNESCSTRFQPLFFSIFSTLRFVKYLSSNAARSIAKGGLQ